MTDRLFFALGAIFAALAVMLGAFGAHTLERWTSPDRLATFEIGVRYQMYHALALLFTGWAAMQWTGWQVRWAGYLFIAGMVVFSGSLYVLVLTNTRWWGALTPFGGLAFIAGWLLLAWAAVKGV